MQFCSYRSILLALILFSTLLIPLRAQYNTTQSKTILSTCHINDDATKDTIVAYLVKADKRWYMQPECIRWGLDTTSPGIITLPFRKTVTWFAYPSWTDLRSTLAVDKFDSDTLHDMKFIISGQYLVGATRRDTTRAVHLFGQRMLITIDTVYLGTVDTLQKNPYVVTRLRTGTNFTDAAVREISGNTSYVFIPPSISDTAGGSPLIATGIEEKPELRLFPNPALYFTNLEIEKLSPGDYHVAVLGITGEIAFEKSITVTNSTVIAETLNLDRLTSGYYILQLRTKNRLIGSYSFMVIH